MSSWKKLATFSTKIWNVEDLLAHWPNVFRPLCWNCFQCKYRNILGIILTWLENHVFFELREILFGVSDERFSKVVQIAFYVSWQTSWKRTVGEYWTFREFVKKLFRFEQKFFAVLSKLPFMCPGAQIWEKNVQKKWKFVTFGLRTNVLR